MNKFGPKAQKEVKKAVYETKHGQLKSGQSDKKVTNQKQAVAIGLSKRAKEVPKLPTKIKNSAPIKKAPLGAFHEV